MIEQQIIANHQIFKVVPKCILAEISQNQITPQVELIFQEINSDRVFQKMQFVPFEETPDRPQGVIGYLKRCLHLNEQKQIKNFELEVAQNSKVAKSYIAKVRKAIANRKPCPQQIKDQLMKVLVLANNRHLGRDSYKTYFGESQFQPNQVQLQETLRAEMRTLVELCQQTEVLDGITAVFAQTQGNPAKHRELVQNLLGQLYNNLFQEKVVLQELERSFLAQSDLAF